MGSSTIGVVACDHAGCDESLTGPTRAAAELDAVLAEGWYYDAASDTAYCAEHRRELGLDLLPLPIPGCTCGALHRPHCQLLRPRGEPTATPWLAGPEQGAGEPVGDRPCAQAQHVRATPAAPRVVTDDDLEI